MAVKEYTSEAANQRPENLNYSVTKILAYIEEISQDIELEHDLPTVCRKIVNLLGHVEIPSQPDQILAFREKIKKVDQFLESMSKNDNNPSEIVTACLQELYKIIMTIEQPSPAAGIVLHRIDHTHIPEATKWFLVSSDYRTEDNIRRGVNTLMSWISSSHFITNLKHWIIGILTGLCDLKKYALLMEIAEHNIDNLLKWSAIPVYNDFVWPIILHMLASIQHSPVIFHRVLKLYVKANSMQLPKNPQLAEQLENTMAALLLHFPNNADTEHVRNKLQPATNFRDSLAVPPWHDQGKVIRRNTNVRVGLTNLGNTCYMNSVLQALMLSKQFTRDLLMADVRTPLFQNMQRLMALLLHSDRPELMPSGVLQTARPPGFSPGHEQDSSEFLGHLLDQLHEQEKIKLAHALATSQPPLCVMDLETDTHTPSSGHVSAQLSLTAGGDDDGVRNADADAQDAANSNNTVNPTGGGGGSTTTDDERRHYHHHDGQLAVAPPTLIQKSFGGVISITYKCLECQTESKQFDEFRDLHLSFPDPESNAPHSVQDLLDFYCTAERLDADNKYFCDQCKRLCVGERYINIVSAPYSLILTLKHFKYDQKYNMRAKLMHKVRHEEVISVQVCTGPDYKDVLTLHYRLYAAVVHSGVSMETGHYFTYGTDAAGICYRFDDSYVCKSHIGELHNLQPPQTPYILFYHRVEDPVQLQQQQQQLLSHSPRKSPKLLASTSATVSVPGQAGGSTTSAVSAISAAPSAAMGSRSPGREQQTTVAITAMPTMPCEYPPLEDLPPQLREHVNRDNILYSEESRSRNESSSVLARNRKNNDSYKPDDDDDDSNGGPPSGCGANFAPSYNHYIS